MAPTYINGSMEPIRDVKYPEPFFPYEDGEVVDGAFILKLKEKYGYTEEDLSVTAKMTGGVRAWWRKGPNADYLYSGVLKQMTTEEALIVFYGYPIQMKELRQSRRNNINRVTVIHMTDIWSHIVYDCRDVITKHYNTAMRSFVTHFHRLVPTKSRAKCSICPSRIQWECRMCETKTSVCLNDPSCLIAHWGQRFDKERDNPIVYPNDDYVRSIFETMCCDGL